MLVIGNGRMIIRDASSAFFENGAVAMDGNTIKMVGVTDEVKKTYPDAEFVDAHGGIIMPAFINMLRRDFWISWMECGGILTAI